MADPAERITDDAPCYCIKHPEAPCHWNGSFWMCWQGMHVANASTVLPIPRVIDPKQPWAAQQDAKP